jgi:hypothetical protein
METLNAHNAIDSKLDEYLNVYISITINNVFIPPLFLDYSNSYLIFRN